MAAGVQKNAAVKSPIAITNFSYELSIMIKAVLIDDEPQSSKALAIKLSSVVDDVEVMATISQAEKAQNSIDMLKPDVVFLDIEMPGLNGFQLLEKLGSISFEIVFVTAYQEYILNALRISALDYLLKPVDKSELEQTVIRLREKLSIKGNTSHKREQLQLFHESIQQVPKRMALATAHGVMFVKTADIIRVEAMSNYSAFYIHNKQKIVVSKTLKEFEPFLTAQNFLRVNRSTIVNIDYVAELRKSEGGIIVLIDKTEIDIAPHRRQELLNRLHLL